MSQKPSRQGSYISINVPETANHATRRRFFSVFRKKTPHSETSAQGTKNAEIRRLLALAKPEKWKIICAIGFLLVSSTVTMAIPYSLGKILDVVYKDKPDGATADEAKQNLFKITTILMGVFVLGAVCNFGRIYFMSIASYKIIQRLRSKVFNSILKQEQGWFDKRSTGELINRLSSDTQVVGQALSTNISDGLRSFVMVCAGTGMMIYMSPKLALVGLTVVPPLVLVAVCYGRFVRNVSKKLQDSLAEAGKVAEERIGNIRTVKTFAQEQREMQTYSETINAILSICYKESKMRGIFYAMTGFSGHVIIISVLYYGGILVATDSLTVGDLSSFLLYAAYIGISLGGLSSFYSELNKSLGSATRLWEIIDREPCIPIQGGLIPMQPPEGHILFKDINFAYPSRNDVQIFKNLNLEITPGRTVAVVGPSGSGKSTLGALLLRLYDPSNGSVILDDSDIKKLDPCWIRRFIGTVSQEPILFSCSIRDNILYGADDPEKVTEEDLMRVAKEANVHEFASQLPSGFNTLVGERGVMLSGGQKQRVAIARALIKNPKILLLDEATSALDAQSEHLVQEALERIMKGRTVLTIAHRLSTIQNADTIAVLKDGVIVEQGSYQELLNLENGVFKDLMKHQTFQVE
ncbi:ATP-binding cassette sub-family B member 10, mitochondrial isoform X2 [Aethina tumida]|nr:ATP-binding cassette sub-family B member 10, mitochondrial isoform X2 [Aethina tumida]